MHTKPTKGNKKGKKKNEKHTSNQKNPKTNAKQKTTSKKRWKAQTTTHPKCHAQSRPCERVVAVAHNAAHEKKGGAWNI
jgi:hypothetical protein